MLEFIGSHWLMVLGALCLVVGACVACLVGVIPAEEDYDPYF